MSWHKTDDPACNADRREDPVALVIEPRERDLGGFSVRRVLPSSKQRSLGPFVFFDQMGPSSLAAGKGIDVRPHPHIGLATLTWMVDGEIRHRDSLGNVQDIKAGAVNWMIAGRGIVHSERSPDHERARPSKLFGIQTWLALPRPSEEVAPAFVHYPAKEIPRQSKDGVNLSVIAGTGWGLESPVTVYSPTLYADIRLDAGSTIQIDTEHDERGVYVLSGSISLGSKTKFEAGRMMVLTPGRDVTLRADVNAHVVVVGGQPLDGRRHIWWNFVSSRPERIEQAKADWAHGRFGNVPDDDEFIPLPSD